MASYSKKKLDFESISKIQNETWLDTESISKLVELVSDKKKWLDSAHVSKRVGLLFWSQIA